MNTQEFYWSPRNYQAALATVVGLSQGNCNRMTQATLANVVELALVQSAQIERDALRAQALKKNNIPFTPIQRPSDAGDAFASFTPTEISFDEAGFIEDKDAQAAVLASQGLAHLLSLVAEGSLKQGPTASLPDKSCTLPEIEPGDVKLIQVAPIIIKIVGIIGSLYFVDSIVGQISNSVVEVQKHDAAITADTLLWNQYAQQTLTATGKVPPPPEFVKQLANLEIQRRTLESQQPTALESTSNILKWAAVAGGLFVFYKLLTPAAKRSNPRRKKPVLRSNPVRVRRRRKPTKKKATKKKATAKRRPVRKKKATKKKATAKRRPVRKKKATKKKATAKRRPVRKKKATKKKATAKRRPVRKKKRTGRRQR